MNSLKKLKQNIKPIHLVTFNLILALWLALALNISFLNKIQQLTPYSGWKAGLFIIATALVLVAIYNLIFQIIHWKWNSKTFAWVWIFIGGFSAYFVNSLGVNINSDQIQNIMQTDSREAFDLLTPRLFIWFLFFICIPFLLLYLLNLKPENLKSKILHKLAAIFASILVLSSLLFTYYVDYAAIFREHRELKGMISPQNTIASTLSYYKKLAPKKNLPLVKYGEDAHLIQSTSTKTPPKIMLLVVGETARAESFSLNGYAKNTNPELSKLDIINFSNVSSCGTATAVSLPCMFSGMTRKDYESRLASHREGLLDLAQRAGYKVTWIDNNSGCKGACDRVNTFIVPEDIKTKWCDADNECHDELLVDSLNAYINQLPANDKESHLIVLHQMGSHGPAYYKRPTEAFQRFKPSCDTNAIQGCSSEALINSYDNTILYTDFVLSQLIQTLEQNNNYQTGLWYLSDHGESTGERGMYLHGAPYSIAPSQQTHIPMLMWFSNQWKTEQPELEKCLVNQKSSQLSQDNLFPTLLSILNIKSATIDPKLNMLQNCQNSTPRA